MIFVGFYQSFYKCYSNDIVSGRILGVFGMAWYWRQVTTTEWQVVPFYNRYHSILLIITLRTRTETKFSRWNCVENIYEKTVVDSVPSTQETNPAWLILHGLFHPSLTSSYNILSVDQYIIDCQQLAYTLKACVHVVYVNDILYIALLNL